MKNKIREILSQTLKSEYDGGNIDDGSIIGGDNAVDQLYDLFVDEMTAIDTATLSSRPESEEPKDRFSRFADTSLFPKTEKLKKAGEILYTDPKTGKTQKLFGTLLPTYTVCIRNENVLDGYKGCAVYITVAALNMEEAKDKAMQNKEFAKHIRMKEFDRKYLSVFNPTGNYVIGKVEYFEGDERL
jgi:hypothetical protein